jgi:hypothetical protein
MLRIFEFKSVSLARSGDEEWFLFILSANWRVCAERRALAVILLNQVQAVRRIRPKQEMQRRTTPQTGELIPGASQSGISPQEKLSPASSVKDFFVTFHGRKRSGTTLLRKDS